MKPPSIGFVGLRHLDLKISKEKGLWGRALQQRRTPPLKKNNVRPADAVGQWNITDNDIEMLAVEVREMFYHAYGNYMKFAFPNGVLKPISCGGEDFELGKIPMLTLIDSLDTLAIMDDREEFRRTVSLVVENVNFDIDDTVSVFETTIRVLGGLLSAHMFAADPKYGFFDNGEYNGGLLRLATDLGNRLLPAFRTPTGIPYGTVNLRRGVPREETVISSTAGAGSLTLEFTMLSALTNERSVSIDCSK